MKTVIAWELARRRWFMLWWTIGISSLIAMTALAYRSLDAQSAQLNDAFGNIEQSAGTFFGGSDFFSPIGYLSSQIYYILLPVLLIIMVVTLVSSLMNRDENDATIELTLARAISRRRLLFAKAVTGLVTLSVVALLTYGVTALTVKAGGLDIDQGHLLLTHLLCFAFSASFGVVGFMFAAMSRATRKIAGVAAVALSFGGYIVTSLAGFVDWLEIPAKLVPYHYYDTVALLKGTVDHGLLWYLAGVLIVATIVSAIGYSRRDIG